MEAHKPKYLIMYNKVSHFSEKNDEQVGLSSPESTHVDCPTMDDRCESSLKSSGRLNRETNVFIKFNEKQNYNGTYTPVNTLQEAAKFIGLTIEMDEEQSYVVSLKTNNNGNEFIAAYCSIEKNKCNGYSLEEVEQEVYTEEFFKNKLTYKNLNFYKSINTK